MEYTQYTTQEITKAMDLLSIREQKIITMRFLGEPMSRAKVAVEFSVYPERIRTIERNALVKLKAFLSRELA